MIYRREIDGLRAVAVLPVILFHAGLEHFHGGFVGVDIFFVISGYLITGLILDEARNDTFSLLRFYERRARRILPALFFVVACSIPFAVIWMLPGQLKEFSESLVAVTTFVSNIFFWRKTGYFELAAEEKPLLHTWSLSVEEQYYILFPLLLVVLWRTAPRAIGPIVVLAGLVSLAIAEYGSREFYTANFYLLPTRAWELLLGATTAIVLLKRDPAAWKHKDTIAWLGLVLVLTSIAVFDKRTPSPSLFTLIPTAGTALILLCAASGTIVGKILSLPPLVALGLISYSAYLWHQPLFAFARVRSAHPPSDTELLFLASASLLLAWVTWRFVELPFRDRARTSRTRVVMALSTAGGVILGLGLLGHHAGGLPRDPSSDIAEQRIEVNYGLSPECDFTESFRVKPECRKGDHPALLVWGDSFAAHLVDGIKAANPALGIVQATRSTCGPILGVSPINRAFPSSWARQCLEFNDSVFHYLESTPEIGVVVLSTQWIQYTDGGFDFLLRDGSSSKDIELVRRAFEATIAKIEALGKKARIVSPPPANGDDLGGCLAKAFLHHESLHECDFSVEQYESYRAPVNRFLHRIERDGASIVWLRDYTCTPRTCAASQDGVFLYRDGGHLSHEGSRWFGDHTGAFAFRSQ